MSLFEGAKTRVRVDSGLSEKVKVLAHQKICVAVVLYVVC